MVGYALRVVVGPQKSLLDNSREAGGKNTAPTPHGHRFSQWFVTVTQRRDVDFFFRLGDVLNRNVVILETSPSRSAAYRGGARRGSAVTMTVAILTPRCRRPALLTRRDAA